MSIDPEKFEPQGKPTVEQVKGVWNAHPQPSARKVATLLVNRGYSISWRTVLRWKANDWTADSAGNAKRTIDANQHTPAAVKKEIRTGLALVPAATVKEANEIAADGGIEAAITGGKLTEDDYARIEKRTLELATKTSAELLEAQEKARTIMNIVVMEEVTRRAHVVALIPKDTGSFLSDAAEAAKVRPADQMPILPVSGPDAGRNGSGARVIEGKATPVSPIASAIDTYLAEHA